MWRGTVKTAAGTGAGVSEKVPSVRGGGGETVLERPGRHGRADGEVKRGCPRDWPPLGTLVLGGGLRVRWVWRRDRSPAPAS